MSGETEQQVSGWTVDTLKEYLEGLLREKNTRDQQRFTALQEAIRIATEANEARFQSVNEFRSQLGDQARTFLPRLEYDRAHTDLVERVDHMRTEHGSRLSKLDREVAENTSHRRANVAVWGYVAGAIGVALGVAGFAMALTR